MTARHHRPQFPVAGLVPAIHVFSCDPLFQDVGARNKSGHGELYFADE